MWISWYAIRCISFQFIRKYTGKQTENTGGGVLRTGFEIQKCYQNESKFNGVYIRNNLSKIK